MAYQVIFKPQADEIRRTLPVGAKAALRVKLNAIARNPHKHGHHIGAGERACPFGGSNRGLIIYIDDAKRLITVTNILWAK